MIVFPDLWRNTQVCPRWSADLAVNLRAGCQDFVSPYMALPLIIVIIVLFCPETLPFWGPIISIATLPIVIKSAQR